MVRNTGLLVTVEDSYRLVGTDLTTGQVHIRDIGLVLRGGHQIGIAFVERDGERNTCLLVLKSLVSRPDGNIGVVLRSYNRKLG